MVNIELNTHAPDFTLPDVYGNYISLSDFVNQKRVLIVLNRGLL